MAKGWKKRTKMEMSKTIKADTLLYGNREEVLTNLHRTNPGYTFKIGQMRLGSESFRSEYPRLNIVSEYRPTLTDHKNRFAIYGGKA